jgi:hypothetical protein
MTSTAIMCYEIADEFAQLYLGYGEEREAKKEK